MHLPIVSTYLDKTSMYKVVLEALLALYGTALVASFFGYSGFTITELLLSGGVITVVAVLTSYLCATVIKVPAQHLSSLITALILILLLLPGTAPYDLFVNASITAFAIVSKYVFVWRKQHVANPVAVGAVAGSLFGFGGAAWWVASPVMFVPILLTGLLVVAKVRRFAMVSAFLGVAFICYMLLEWTSGVSTSELVTTFLFSFPFLFLACFMLTEPFTMPGTQTTQVWYGVLTGILVSVPSFAGFVMTPELALVIANVAFFGVGVRQKLFLPLISVKELTPRIYEFSFQKPEGFTFMAGQYLEWMLPHAHADVRGVRRYFTIASSPLDPVVQVALKVPESASSYKQALQELPVGEQVIASQRAGDFVLPDDEQIKIGWIAGGIGVTPFVSQTRHLLQTVSTRDIVTLYAAQTKDDFPYYALLEQVSVVIPIVTQGEVIPGGESGYVSADVITRRVPDFKERTWYISGPPIMVQAAKKALRSLGVPTAHIREDFFPGLA